MIELELGLGKRFCLGLGFKVRVRVRIKGCITCAQMPTYVKLMLKKMGYLSSFCAVDIMTRSYGKC